MRHARHDASAAGGSPVPAGPLFALRSSGALARLWALCTGLVAACVAFSGAMPLLEPSQASSLDGGVLGQTVASGIDVGADIARYYAYFLVFLVAGVASFAGASLLEARLGGASEKDDGLLGAAREYGWVAAFLALLSPLVGWPVWPALLCYALCTLHYALGLANRRGLGVLPQTVRAALLALFPYAAFGLVSLSLSGGSPSAAAALALGLACVALLASALAYVLAYRRSQGRFAASLARASLAPLAVCAATPVLLELKNVLVVRGLVSEPRPYALHAALMALATAAFVALRLWDAREGREVPDGRRASIERAAIVLLVVAVLLSAAQPPVSVEYGTDYFESANHGLALDGLFRRGELPVVESFDAHMLLRQLTGILYYLLNPYEPWANAIYNSLRSLPVFIVLYRVLAHFLSERSAALWVLLSPVCYLLLCAGPPADSLSFAFLSLWALWRALRRPGARSYALFCVCVVLTCLIGLDAGVAAIVAGAVTFLVCLLRDRGRVRIAPLAAVAAATIAACLLLWAALCLARGVDPVSRLREFVLLAASNANWAVYPVGDLDAFVTPLVYFVAPLGGAALLAWLSLVAPVDLGAGEGRERRVALAWVCAVFLCAFFLANLSRGVVRHNLTEGSAGALLSTLPAAVLCAVVYVSLRRGEGVAGTFGRFVLAGACTTALFGVAATDGVGFVGGFESQLVQAVAQWGSAEQYKQAPEGGTRVTGGSTADETLAAILDATTGDDETYLTLSSTDYLYAIVGRKNPIYANQSPMILSGTESQELALDEVAAARVTYVLMPRDAWTIADDLDVCLKYYLLFEYVYENYEPFVRIDGADYDLWCLSDERDELAAALERGGPEGGWSFVEGYEPGFLGQLGLIPLLWGEDAEASADAGAPLAASDGARTVSVGENVAVALSGEAGGEPAYLELVVDAPQDGEMTVELGETGRVLRLALRAGEHRYLVRVSAYYEWWEGAVGSIGLTSSLDVELRSLSVLGAST